MTLLLPGQIKKWSHFYYELAQLTKSGFLPIDSLKKIQADRLSTEIQIICSHLLHGMNAGRSFAVALKPIAKSFPVLDRALITAGEKSGRLDETFKTLADYYTREARWRSKLILQMMYPFALINGAILLFPSSRIKLLIDGDVIGFFKTKIPALLALYATLFIPGWLLNANQSLATRQFVEGVLSRIPLLGRARRSAALARFCLALEGLVSAGITPDQSWPLASQASGSSELEQAVLQMLPYLKKGSSPAELISKNPVFPALFVSQYRTGEMAGKIDESLKKLSEYFGEQADRETQIIVDWLPRIAYGAIVAFVIYQTIEGLKSTFTAVETMGP